MVTNATALVVDARLTAHNYFHSLTPPTTTESDWRFSSVIPKVSFLGAVGAQSSFFRDVGDGAFMCDLAYFCEQFPDLAQQYCFGREYKKAEPRYFAAYVQAYWNRSFVLFVPAGVQVQTPCFLDLQYGNTMVVENLYVIVQPRASIVIHDTVEVEHAVYRSIVWYIGQRAQVKVISDEKNGASAVLLSSSQYFLGDSSTLTWYQSSSVVGYSKQWWDILLSGRGAQMTVHAVGAVGGAGYAEIITLQEHNACDTTSSVVVHTVAAGQAQVVYQGLIVITEHAARVVAAQKNKILLCSDKARAWSVPALQVSNNDVQCSHGSAISQVDAQQLWYLQSRGLAQQTAHNLLLQAFFACLEHVNMSVFLPRMHVIVHKEG